MRPESAWNTTCMLRLIGQSRVQGSSQLDTQFTLQAAVNPAAARNPCCRGVCSCSWFASRLCDGLLLQGRLGSFGLALHIGTPGPLGLGSWSWRGMEWTSAVPADWHRIIGGKYPAAKVDEACAHVVNSFRNQRFGGVGSLITNSICACHISNTCSSAPRARRHAQRRRVRGTFTRHGPSVLQCQALATR
jgi:hypothetical protein